MTASIADGFAAVVHELQVGRAEASENAATIIRAIHALTVRSEQTERVIVRELRVIGNRLSNVDERLAGIDDKLTDIREHVTRVEERTL